MRHRMYKVGKNDLYRKKVMYLVRGLWGCVFGKAGSACMSAQHVPISPIPTFPQLNHRSWADLIIDQYATEGRSTFLSR